MLENMYAQVIDNYSDELLSEIEDKINNEIELTYKVGLLEIEDEYKTDDKKFFENINELNEIENDAQNEFENELDL